MTQINTQEDQVPAFVIFQDPTDEQEEAPTELWQHPKRIALAEIRLPSWGNESNCGSTLKHEMLLSQSEPFHPSLDLVSSSSGVSSSSEEDEEEEETKENILLRSLQALSLQTPRKFSSSLTSIAPASPIKERTQPSNSTVHLPSSLLPPDLKHNLLAYTTPTPTSSPSSIFPFRI